MCLDCDTCNGRHRREDLLRFGTRCRCYFLRLRVPGLLRARGRDISFSRDRGNCIVCHAMLAPDERLHGDVGPSLEGVAGRLTEGQMRLRLVDGRRLNPSSLMPSYYRADGLKRVATAYAGKTVLTAEEIEDVLAYLMTLRPDEKR